MKSRQWIFVLITLAITMTACRFTREFSGRGSENEQLATMVAATLTAVHESVPEATPEPPVIQKLRVAYIKDGNVWMWTDGIGAIQLTARGMDIYPHISDDGKIVAFIREEEIWGVNSDGSNEQLLVGFDYFSGLIPSSPGNRVVFNDYHWVPGSHILLFDTREQGQEFSFWRKDLHRVDFDSPSVTQLLKPNQGGSPSFSQDGMKVALVQGDKLNVMNVDGSGYRPIFSFPSVFTYSEWEYLPQVVWMSDSQSLRTVIPAQDPLGVPDQPTRLWHIPLSGSPVQLEVFVSLPAFISRPLLSPDGQRVVFLRDNGPNNDLLIRDAGGGDHIYASQPDGEIGILSWASDSQKFLFWTGEHYRPRYGEIGSPETIVDPLNNVSDPRWAGNDKLLFLSGSELRIKRIGERAQLIDFPVSWYDFDE